MVTVGWPLTVTRGFGTVAWACPPCEHSTVAPTCTRNPGMFSPYLREATGTLDDDQRAFINGDGGTGHHDPRALAVLNVNSRIVHDDGGARCAFQHDAASWARQIADDDGVLQRGLDDDVRISGNSGQRQRRNLCHVSPPT